MPRRIDIKGPIVDTRDGCIYDWLGIENTSPGKVVKALQEANGEAVEVYINSPGGSVPAGAEIYTELRSYTGKKTIKIVGMAASAASVVAQAGDSEISPTGILMIHNVRTRVNGDYRDMDNTGDALRAANQSIINAYVDKTGLSVERLQELMDRETYMSAQQAVEYGFVDRVMFADNPPQLVNAMPGMLSKESIEKIRNIIGNSDQPDSDFFNAKSKAAARLKLLSLTGGRKAYD